MSTTPRSASQHARLAFQAALLLCLLRSVVNGFLLSPSRTTTAANHHEITVGEIHVLDHVGSPTARGCVATRSRRCNAVSPSAATQDVAIDEVIFSPCDVVAWPGDCVVSVDL